MLLTAESIYRATKRVWQSKALHRRSWTMLLGAAHISSLVDFVYASFGEDFRQSWY